MSSTPDPELPTQMEVEAVSAHLESAVAGGPKAAGELMPLVYDELRRLAGQFLHRERKDHTLQPTALVNEAYLRLVDQTRVNWQGRAHFFAIAARMMRRVLIDHARGKARAKRGGDAQRVTLVTGLAATGDRALDLLALDDALDRLSQLNERHAKQVELRFFAGLEVAEVAEVLGTSQSTVEADWRIARAWLRMQLSD